MTSDACWDVKATTAYSFTDVACDHNCNDKYKYFSLVSENFCDDYHVIYH